MKKTKECHELVYKGRDLYRNSTERKRYIAVVRDSRMLLQKEKKNGDAQQLEPLAWLYQMQ